MQAIVVGLPWERLNERTKICLQLSEHKAQLSRRAEVLKRKELKIEHLTYEMATLKRWQYARRGEQLDEPLCRP